jgi:hypothetical protein
MDMETVDKRTPEREDYPPLKEPTEFVVSDNVSMIVEDGEVTFIDFKTNQTVTMSEWDFSEVDLVYLHARLEEKNPTLKANRLERERYEAEQEKNNDE